MFFKKNTALKAYADGKMIPITEVEDPVFSQKIMGDGLAIQPEGNTIYAPCDGKVTVTFDKTQHAVGIAMKNKMEILLHVGLDTVNLQEEIFHTLVKSGDDVKQGLSIAVALRSNFERLYTGQTKHKVVSPELKKIIVQLFSEKLTEYFSKNPAQLKELTTIVKMNAKARREGDKVRTAVVKGTLNSWASYKMKNYDPCTNKGIKEYKELYIIEGDQEVS